MTDPTEPASTPRLDLEAFAVACVSAAWEGFGLDGGEIEDLAIRHGMVERVEFDPAIHVDADASAEAGDPWLIFTPAFKAILDAAESDGQGAGHDESADMVALQTALARAEKERDALRRRYEDWRPVSEPPGEYHRQFALIHFYMPGGSDDEGDAATWITRTWSERPSSATHWCLIVSPLGPHGV